MGGFWGGKSTKVFAPPYLFTREHAHELESGLAPHQGLELGAAAVYTSRHDLLRKVKEVPVTRIFRPQAIPLRAVLVVPHRDADRDPKSSR